MSGLDRRQFLGGAAAGVMLEPMHFERSGQTDARQLSGTEVHRAQPTATTPDTMVALTDPIFPGQVILGR
jgi:hypothetical protein